MRLTNNIIRMRPTPPLAGWADLSCRSRQAKADRIAKAVSFDWLHAPGLSG